MKNIIKLTETELHKIIKENVIAILSESRNVKSKRLYDIIQQHGGIQTNNGVFDIHNLSDEDIIDVITYSDWRYIVKNGIRKFAQTNNINLDIADTLDVIELKDGNYLLCKLRGGNFDRISKQANAEREKLPGDFELLHNKTNERTKNRYPRKGDYVWNNKDAEDLFHNPFFRKSEGNWTPQNKQQAMDNIRNNKRWFE